MLSDLNVARLPLASVSFKLNDAHKLHHLFININQVHSSRCERGEIRITQRDGDGGRRCLILYKIEKARVAVCRVKVVVQSRVRGEKINIETFTMRALRNTIDYGAA
eukprot:scaffold3029_cov33-Tisochrysis_lutea.AAC.6